ncbi:MAG: ketoacyl-ACP synthase III [Desulfobacteraceae bacterium]|jgi:3-oxoacyl-[acyl-carrier-protein] synthase-3|nr:ketoacyl-ACP synthase III [Desulfobacteraceae bacterium]
MKVAIKAIEYFLPDKVENGETLKRDNPDWRIAEIEDKTGIKKRHISDENQNALELARLSALKLFEKGIQRETIDFLILVTQSAGYALPTSACILQEKLGLGKKCLAFDINLGCSGFIYGFAVAGSLIEAGLADNGLLICSDTYTKYIGKKDRACRPIFSDGASATLLGRSDKDILGPFEFGTDGSGFYNLIVPSQTSGVPEPIINKASVGQLYMDGTKLLMFAMNMVPKCISSLLSKSSKTIDDIDMYIFHQAGKVVIDNIKRRLKLPDEKVLINYDKIGNTVSSSIPIALKQALEQNLIQDGDQIMLVGFGVGYSWGGCIVNWDKNSWENL